MTESLHVLFQDEHLVAVAKPSGMAVHRGWARKGAVVLQSLRDRLGARVYPVHRLDRATSGVVLFALDADTAGSLGGMFERGEVKKRYLALVRGVAPERGSIDQPVPRTEKGERVAAVTDFSLVAASQYERCSLVEARPRTGRLHQIRRHLKHINHPVVGDVRYGHGELNRHYRRCWAVRRLALHAWSVELTHPKTGDTLTVTCPVPEDLGRPLQRLGLPIEL